MAPGDRMNACNNTWYYVMNGYFVKNIGMNRGKPRIWLQGIEVSQASFQPGDKYEVQIKGGTVILKANPDGSRTISRKENKKTGSVAPIIDIESKELLALFDGMDSIRVVQRQGEIYLLPLASELRKKERLNRLRTKLQNGVPLDVASLSHGAGLMSSAIHDGLLQEGVPARPALINEIRPELLEHSSTHLGWESSTVPVGAPMQEFAFDDAAMRNVSRAEVLEMGLPCSGASVAGRAKRKTSMPEDHPEVGHLVVAALVILAKLNPALVLLENVIPYASSASASILRNQLRDMGYNTHETILRGEDFNALEHRDRWVMVAATEGIHFDWDMLVMPEKKEMLLSDVLDDIPLDDPSWSEMTGLKAKQERDLANGKNFKMQLVDGDDVRIPTLTKGLAKNRSTDPKIKHPSNPDLLRMPTPQEHAKVKQFPPSIVAGLSKTLAHEALGQAVLHDPIASAGRLIAQALKGYAFENDPSDAVQLAKSICTEIENTAGLVASEVRGPVPGVAYTGRLTACDLGMAIQDIGNGVGILHKHSSVMECRVGEEVTIKYRSPKAEPTVERHDVPAPDQTAELKTAMLAAAQQQDLLFDADNNRPTSPRMR